MTPSPQSTGNPTLDRIRAGQLDDPKARQAVEFARTMGLGLALPPSQSDPAQPPAPKPIMPPSQPVPSLSGPSVPSPNQQEYGRITKPPIESGPLAHTKADTGRSGIGQIKHAGFRIPLQIADAIGSAFLPSLTSMIPGTELHHQMRVGETSRAVGREEEQATGEAQRRHLEAETAELPARAEHERAQAEAALHPTPKTVFERWAKENPRATIEDWLKLQDEHRPITNEFEAWSKDPANKGKSVSEFMKLKTENGPKPNETPFDAWRKQNPNKPAEEWLKLEESVKARPPNEYADFKAGYTKAHPEATADQIVKEYAKAHQAPADRGQNFVDPETGTLTRVQPGGVVPKGAMTPNQAGSVNTPTMQMRNVAAQAALVHEQTPHMLSEIDRLKDSLGPVMGRWNDFMQGKAGLDNPDFAGLRADLLMYSSAVALMHARGRLPENLRAEFEHAINAPKQSPENLKAVIKRIDDWTGKNAAAMGGKSSATPSSGAPTLEEVNAEIERRKGVKK